MGLFRVTLLPGGKAAPVVLCDSGDPLPTHQVSLNTRPVYEYVNFAQADFATALYHGNRRNTLAFSVTRRTDDTAALFASPVAAFTWAFQFTNVLPGLSTAKIELTDDSAKGIFYLQNCACDRANLTDMRGIKLGYQYVLNGGAITY
ncbi:MAG: hypothetical protein KGL39_50965 [Patescibacteria group bacterium]|nr:hypothetical protein [Patescibacteria group bacterium]